MDAEALSHSTVNVCVCDLEIRSAKVANDPIPTQVSDAFKGQRFDCLLA